VSEGLTKKEFEYLENAIRTYLFEMQVKNEDEGWEFDKYYKKESEKLSLILSKIKVQQNYEEMK
jgi:hypothetical protein